MEFFSFIRINYKVLLKFKKIHILFKIFKSLILFRLFNDLSLLWFNFFIIKIYLIYIFNFILVLVDQGYFVASALNISLYFVCVIKT